MNSKFKITIYKMSQEDINSIKKDFSSGFDKFWTYENLIQDFKSDKSTYFVAKDNNNTIVGFIGIKIVLDNADIMNIAVKKGYRNQGIGSLLLEHAISYSSSRKCSQIMLEVNSTNFPAISLYEKFYFKKIAIRQKYYNQTNDAIIMKKIL